MTSVTPRPKTMGQLCQQQGTWKQEYKKAGSANIRGSCLNSFLIKRLLVTRECLPTGTSFQVYLRGKGG